MPRGSKSAPTERDAAILDVIERERARQGVSQEALGLAAKMSQSQASRTLAGVRPVTLTELLAMMSLLGLSLGDVARLAGEP